MINKLKYFSMFCISLIPNAFILKSLFSNLPDLTIVIYSFLYISICLIILFNKKNFVKLKKIDCILFIWILFTLMDTLVNDFKDTGFFLILKVVFMGLFLYFSIPFTIKNKKEYFILIKYFLITTLVLNLIVITEFILQGMPYGRFEFFGAHPIPLGMMGAVTAIVSLTTFVFKKINILYFIVTVIPSVIVVVLSSSKGPFLSMVLGLILLLPSIIFSFKKIGIISIFLSSILYFVPKLNSFQLMMYRLTNVENDQSTLDRIGNYKMGLDLFYENPIVGGGMGAFTGVSYPHNIIIEFLAQGGIIGGIFIASFILWVIINYFDYLLNQRGNYEYTLSIIILFISLFILMVSYTFVDLKFLYFGSGLIVASKNIIKIENQNSQLSLLYFSPFLA